MIDFIGADAIPLELGAFRKEITPETGTQEAGVKAEVATRVGTLAPTNTTEAQTNTTNLERLTTRRRPFRTLRTLLKVYVRPVFSSRLFFKERTRRSTYDSFVPRGEQGCAPCRVPCRAVPSFDLISTERSFFNTLSVATVTTERVHTKTLPCAVPGDPDGCASEETAAILISLFTTCSKDGAKC